MRYLIPCKIVHLNQSRTTESILIQICSLKSRESLHTSKFIADRHRHRERILPWKCLSHRGLITLIIYCTASYPTRLIIHLLSQHHIIIYQKLIGRNTITYIRNHCPRTAQYRSSSFAAYHNKRHNSPAWHVSNCEYTIYIHAAFHIHTKHSPQKGPDGWLLVLLLLLYDLYSIYYDIIIKHNNSKVHNTIWIPRKTSIQRFHFRFFEEEKYLYRIRVTIRTIM